MEKFKTQVPNDTRGLFPLPPDDSPGLLVCPIKFLLCYVDVNSDATTSKCSTERCGWYDKANGRCGIIR